MRYLFRRDTFLITLSIFLVIGVLLNNPLNSHLFNPLKVSLTDFALTDLAFSAAHLKGTVDDRIFIVNVDTAGRETIARILDTLKTFQPKVIGLDLLLAPRASPGNAALQRALRSPVRGIAPVPIVLCQTIAYNHPTGRYDLSPAAFHDVDTLSGYVNFVSEEGNMVRFFPPFLQDDSGHFYASFAAVIAREYDSIAYKGLTDRKHDLEMINYQRPDSGFYSARFDDVLEGRVDPAFIRGRIVLVGYLASSPDDVKDKHFTPLNGKVLGRSLPDMNGIVIHANILSMIMDQRYIHRAPDGILMAIALILTWLHVAALLKYYIHRHLWFHLIVKTIEFAVSILIFYASVLMLRFWDIDIDFTWTLLAIIIAVEVFYFYEALVNWLGRKYSYHSIFSQMHHE